MHNALLISEVLGTIVNCLVDDIRFPDEDPSRQALAMLARTCHAFSELALNGLWHRLHSLRPFILCLPTKASYDDTTDEALPPFNEEEWNVVLRYAPRVHELTLERDDVSVKILQSLSFCTVLLLPNLRKLNWVYGDHLAVASIRFLLSPSLVHLWVRLEDGDDTSILAFLQWYHTFCPNIKSLSFNIPARFPHVTAAISRAITRSLNVETLSCDNIDEEALVHIAQSRRLKRFSCRLLNHQPDALRRLAGYGSLDRPLFENVRFLDLCVKDLSSIIPYLKSQNQPFEDVYFRTDSVSTPEVFHELFTALSSATRRRTLRRIRLFTYFTAFDFSAHPVDFRVLSPLLNLNLHAFYINIRNPISLNDDEFVRLVHAWPELETLHVNNTSGWNYPRSVQRPTLRGLLLLLIRCPKLRDLGLCIDATRIPSLSEHESSIRNGAITKLSVSNSPIEVPVAQVARFLLEHLPSLIAVSVCPSGSGQLHYHWTWRKVDIEIKEIVGHRSPEWSGMELW